MLQGTGCRVQGACHGAGFRVVCKRSQFTVEGERCVVSSRSLFKRLEVNEEEEDSGLATERFGAAGGGAAVRGSLLSSSLSFSSLELSDTKSMPEEQLCEM